MVMFALVKWLRQGANTVDSIGNVAVHATDVAKISGRVSRIFKPDTAIAVGDVCWIAAADALPIIPRRMKKDSAQICGYHSAQTCDGRF